ncbi:MAG: outer membrane beta-barrel protein [Bacteroidota bacterium]
MKIRITLTIALSVFISHVLFAQNPRIKKEKNDTTVFLWSGLKILVFNDPDADKKQDTIYKPVPIKKPLATFYEGIDIGVNGLMEQGNFSTNLNGSSNNLDLDYGGSWNLHLNLVEKQLNLYKKKLSLVSGFGLDYNGYKFSSKNVKLYNDIANNKISFDTSTVKEYTKNKLRVSSIEVPLLIGFSGNKKNPDKGVKVAIGIVGSYIYNSKYKLSFLQNKESIELVAKDNYHLRPFNLKATARVGYKNFMLFANYSLFSLFKDGQGPDIRPFEIGISL